MLQPILTPPKLLNLGSHERKHKKMIAIGKEVQEDFSDDGEFGDWQMPLAFTKKRHLENIVGAEITQQTWRMKERVRTFRLDSYTPYFHITALLSSDCL